MQDVINALSPNSERAASLNSFVCAIKSSGPILMYGWIVGTTWLTFPASVEPIPNLSLRFTSSLAILVLPLRRRYMFCYE